MVWLRLVKKKDKDEMGTSWWIPSLGLPGAERERAPSYLFFFFFSAGIAHSTTFRAGTIYLRPTSLQLYH